MKLVALSLLLLTSSLYASMPEEQEQCVTVCKSTGQHTYQQHGRIAVCHEIMRCEVYQWDDDAQSCELLREENRRYPMQCRDIPPAY